VRRPNITDLGRPGNPGPGKKESIGLHGIGLSRKGGHNCCKEAGTTRKVIVGR